VRFGERRRNEPSIGVKLPVRIERVGVTLTVLNDSVDSSVPNLDVDGGRVCARVDTIPGTRSITENGIGKYEIGHEPWFEHNRNKVRADSGALTEGRA